MGDISEEQGRHCQFPPAHKRAESADKCQQDRYTRELATVALKNYVMINMNLKMFLTHNNTVLRLTQSLICFIHCGYSSGPGRQKAKAILLAIKTSSE